MSNPNPNTTGLRPFNTMPRSESAEIQSAGGKARAEKTRKIKTIKEIIQSLRSDAPVDPIEIAVSNLYSNISNPMTPTSEITKAILTIHKIIGDEPASFECMEPHKPEYDPVKIARIHQEIIKLSQEEEAKARARGEIQ